MKRSPVNKTFQFHGGAYQLEEDACKEAWLYMLLPIDKDLYGAEMLLCVYLFMCLIPETS